MSLRYQQWLPCMIAAAMITVSTAMTADANSIELEYWAEDGVVPQDGWRAQIRITDRATELNIFAESPPLAAGTPMDEVARTMAAVLATKGVDTTLNGNKLEISQHNQTFNFDPLARGTKISTGFGGQSGGPDSGWVKVKRTFMRWQPQPPPPMPLPLPPPVPPIAPPLPPILPPLPQLPTLPGHWMYPILPPDQFNQPGLELQFLINLLDVHGDPLFGQQMLLPGNAQPHELSQIILEAFAGFPQGLGDWFVLPTEDGHVAFGNMGLDWMQGGGIELEMLRSQPGHLQLGLESVEFDPAALLTADFDKDGDVDGEDFLIWQQNVGVASGATMNDGDADMDGDVDGEDFLHWQEQFGLHIVPPDVAGGHAGSAAVPEPTGGILLLLLGVSSLASRRR